MKAVKDSDTVASKPVQAGACDVSLGEIPENVSEMSLTGDQVKFIRQCMGESQREFAARFAVSQPVIHRIEARGATVLTSPEVALIWTLAKRHKINLDDMPAPEETSSAETPVA